MADTKFCEKCKKVVSIKEFYKTNNTEKYQDGYLNQCKKCITMFVDNWNPDTFLWILQEADVPWIPAEWDKLMSKYARDRSKVTGATILGRYLSAMQLKQHKDYRWKDTQFLQELADMQVEQAMKRQGYEAAEITKQLMENRASIPEGDVIIPEFDDASFIQMPFSAPPAPRGDYFAEQNSEYETDLSTDLTEDDKRYLCIKWGRTYKPDEWVRLEQLYSEMKESYDIQGAGHEDVLKLVCKTSLKSNQLLDIGDVDGAQKMVKMYDSLMKSGKFTAAQNKAEHGEFVDSVGELIEFCEKRGYIERFYVEQPNDKVDFCLQDMQRYTKTLVTEETNLAALIEQALKNNAREDENAANATDEDIVDDYDLIDDIEKELSVSDYEEFGQFLDDEEDEDAALLEALNSEGYQDGIK